MTAVDDRRALVRTSRDNPALTPVNGIDYIEVDPANEASLVVTFVFDVAIEADIPPTAVGAPLSQSAFAIAGGERITGITVTSIARAASNAVTVTVSEVGDFSIYTLTLATPPGFDPILSGVAFLFHIECASRFDCGATPACPPTAVIPPPIDYLAKDYPTFVQVMLDRLALLSPGWSERNAADLGVTIVELLAYVADHLAYRLDVVDTEAYLGTARLRTSARRHARLVDYPIDDGCNARAWLALSLTGDIPNGVPVGTRCCTQFGALPIPTLPTNTETYLDAIAAGAQFFEVAGDRFLSSTDPPMPWPRPLYAVNNVMPTYGWSAQNWCIPAGATSATLAGAYTLHAGDVLILVDQTDETKRTVVRLSIDGVPGYDPLYGIGQPITTITWYDADALTFPLCASDSLVYGNVVLVDHGRTLGLPLETMPEPLAPVPASGRYRPNLNQPNVTFAAPNPFVTMQAASAATSLPGAGAATIDLMSVDTGGTTQQWTLARDLVGTDLGPDTPAFVVELETDGTTYILFGDGVTGLAPSAATQQQFAAQYRVGSGAVGNVARESILYMDTTFEAGGYVAALWNPLPAFGGRDPETIEHVRQSAPYAFRTQERCVTVEDWQQRVEGYPGVQRAAAQRRWTGSWNTIFVTVERTAEAALDPAFKAGLETYLDQFRLAGYDLDVEDVTRVPLTLAMHLCVLDGYVRTDVEAVVRAIFTSGLRPDGTPGVFNPTLLDMGDPYYLSPLIAAAQAIDGVQSVRIDTFERQDQPNGDGIAAGVLTPGPFEAFELANDPNYPERGEFLLTLDGGL